MKRYWDRIWKSVQLQDAGVAEPTAPVEISLPTIWLLGKTGAGKSTLVGTLTGISDIDIGNGFEPCTRCTQRFPHPPDRPVLQFLDTRGIGEAGYNPAADLAEYSAVSNAVLAIARIDDPAQGELCGAVRSIRKAFRRSRMIVVHSHADAVADDEERSRMRIANQQAIASAARRSLPWIETGARDLAEAGRLRQRLLALLQQELPLPAFAVKAEPAGSAEQRKFSHIRARVVQFALQAAASDLVPVYGSAAVPVMQARMLVELARHYDTTLTRELLAQLGSAIGAGLIARYMTGHAARQAGKLIPGYGVLAGTLLAGSASFATTFAIGRATGYFLFHLQKGGIPDHAATRQVYKSALKDAWNSYKSDS